MLIGDVSREHRVTREVAHVRECVFELALLNIPSMTSPSKRLLVGIRRVD